METETLRAVMTEYGIRDVIPAIKEYVNEGIDLDEFRLYGFPVEFQSSKDHSPISWKPNYQLMALNKIKEKYTDFVDMVWRKVNDMRIEFSESGISKIYYSDHDCEPHIVFSFLRKRGEHNYQFKMVVFVTGKGKSSYWGSAGNINIDIN